MTQEAKPGARSAGDPTPGSGGPMGPTANRGLDGASKVISVIVLKEGPRGLVLRESRVDVGSDVPGGGAA
jgi:hypothetical protein